MIDDLVALLHPDGAVRQVHREPDAMDLELVLLDGGDRGRDGSLGQLLRSCVQALSPDGVLVVVSTSRRRRRSLARDVARAGAHVEATFAALPGARSVRQLVPLEGGAAAWTLRRLLASRPWGRLASRAVAAPGAVSLLRTTAPAVAFVARRPGARRLAAWLQPHVASYDSLAVGATHPERDARVLLAFARGGRPLAAVKVGAGAAAEAAQLELLSAPARAAGARVPEVLATQRLGSAEALVEAPLEGRPVVELLRGRPKRVADVLEVVVGWLERWNRATRTPVVLDTVELERVLLGPAELLARDLGRPYLERMRLLADHARDREIPFVAAHNDLTMWNLVLDGDGSLGVLDWEAAAPRCLPLGDLLYAAVDAVAATTGYSSRARAAHECFSPRGSHSSLAVALRSRLADALELAPLLVEVCVHACWLHHAVNERRLGRGREFLDVVQGL